ncbi:MAG: phenylalanine--tRNA ligase subunit beta [Candidatus Delongbacteria bacterium]|nr:phenylalanine--tRNA ligase subunit beta [Candidatus Delongbacteria bacterium]
MKISANWLKDYIDFDINTKNANEIAHRLAILGFEPESIEHISNNFDNFVVGKVTECIKHPDADRLTVCKVDVGNEELQIVCGAPNVKEGQSVPVALVGAKFPDFKIKKAKMRGVESNGMICAEDELGLSDDHDGIMILDDKHTAGTPFKELFGYEDHVFDLEVTSNRADALGYLGFGREFAYMVGKKLKIPEFDLAESKEKIENFINIEIKDIKACPRYSARLIKGVKVKESPKWLKEKLIAVGLRPINNVVDITNFVLMETGHPLHAFDYNDIAGEKIIVRKAKKGEKFITLDENKFELNNKILLICDDERPIALAGVMGGLNSGVTEKTTDVLLEVAYFNLADIRQTVKHTNILSDSSKRFERGVDPNNAEYVIDRAAALINELAGGKTVKGIFDVYPNKIKEITLDLRLSRTEKLLGFKINKKEIIESFSSIDLRTKEKTKDILAVTIPTFRPDITREIDLIEEVVRLYGYDKIPDIVKSNINLNINEDKEELEIDMIREHLVDMGLFEISAKSMVDHKYTIPFEKKPVKIQHPLNEEMNHLRNSLLISLLNTAGKNIRRKYDNINIFEVGKIFYHREKELEEKNSFAVLLTGINRKQQWNEKEIEYDFYDIKGIAEQFFAMKKINDIKFEPENIPSYYNKSQSLSVFLKGKKIAVFGKLSTETTKAFEIKNDIFCFEMLVEDSMNLDKGFTLKKLSKYPKVIKDISVLMDMNEESNTIKNVIKKYGGKYLQNTETIDLYQGKQIESNKKSYTFRMEFQSMDKTLADKEIDKIFNKIINGLKKDLKVEIR